MQRLLRPIPLAVIASTAALIGLLGYGVVSKEPDTGLDRAVARNERPAAPPIELERLGGGGRGSLADYRGKVVVLNFWASWCTPCKTESPLLQRWHERIASRGGTVLGVDARDVSSDALDFVRRYRLTYPMLHDGPGDRLDPYGVAAYPETFVIDREGRIVAIARGEVSDDFLRRNVPPLLEEPA